MELLTLLTLSKDLVIRNWKDRVSGIESKNLSAPQTIRPYEFVFAKLSSSWQFQLKLS
jgi:hypothetical protein